MYKKFHEVFELSLLAEAGKKHREQLEQRENDLANARERLRLREQELQRFRDDVQAREAALQAAIVQYCRPNIALSSLGPGGSALPRGHVTSPGNLDDE